MPWRSRAMALTRSERSFCRPESCVSSSVASVSARRLTGPDVLALAHQALDARFRSARARAVRRPDRVRRWPAPPRARSPAARASARPAAAFASLAWATTPSARTRLFARCGQARLRPPSARGRRRRARSRPRPAGRPRLGAPRSPSRADRPATWRCSAISAGRRCQARDLLLRSPRGARPSAASWRSAASARSRPGALFVGDRRRGAGRAPVASRRQPVVGGAAFDQAAALFGEFGLEFGLAARGPGRDRASRRARVSALPSSLLAFGSGWSRQCAAASISAASAAIELGCLAPAPRPARGARGRPRDRRRSALGARPRRGRSRPARPRAPW